MTFWLCWGLGVLVGVAVTNVLWIVCSGHGILKIDKTNPEKDIYRLDINDLDALSRKKRILLKVDARADLSQK